MPLTTDGYTFPLADGVTRRSVRYPHRYGIQIAADLYVPTDLDVSVSHPAVVVGPPHGGVKEQGPGVYARSWHCAASWLSRSTRPTTARAAVTRAT